MSLILMNNAIGKTAESTASRESTANRYGNPHFASASQTHKSLPA
jgi:hypothetical protein